MSVRIIRILARVLSWLPLRLNQATGALIGYLAWVCRSRSRQITEVNLAICFPDLDSRARTTMARRSLVHTGMQLTECAWIWHRPFEDVEDRIIEICGEQQVIDALDQGKGCLLVSPHLGNWELCSAPLSKYSRFTYFYRSPRQAALDSELVRWRAHLKGAPAALDAAGIRRGLKVLRAGEIIGILPDQEPDRQNGVFVPFFNQPTLTMTLLARLVQRSGARVLFCVAERLPRGQGWRFHVRLPDQAIYSDDVVEATAALNSGVEECIALCPEQYLWSYKRFNTPPDGKPRPYARQTSPARR